jgi:histidine triad (HIT) family protein
MNNCIFCEIVAKRIPSHCVYETEDIYVFMDVNPLNDGHMLVIPKTHYETIFDMSEQFYSKISSVAWKLSRAIKTCIRPDGLCIIQSNYKAADQIIPHFHLHLIPRFEKDYLHISRWKLYPGDPDRIKDISHKIKTTVL